MEIPPQKANLTQVLRARDGQMVEVEDDVQGCANALGEIDPHLRLRYSEAGEYWVVYWLPDGDEEGNGYLVTTAQELDHRLVKEVERIYWQARQPGYSFASELERVDKEAERKREAEFSDRMGAAHEQLAHAIRRDLGAKPRIFVPER